MFKYTAMDSLNKGVEWCEAHLACPPPLPPPPPPSPRWYPPRSWEPPPYFFLFMAPSHAAAAAAASASAQPPQCRGRECAPPVVTTPGSRSSSSGLDLSGPRCRRRRSGLPPRPLLSSRCAASRSSLTTLVRTPKERMWTRLDSLASHLFFLREIVEFLLLFSFSPFIPLSPSLFCPTCQFRGRATKERGKGDKMNWDGHQTLQ